MCMLCWTLELMVEKSKQAIFPAFRIRKQSHVRKQIPARYFKNIYLVYKENKIFRQLFTKHYARKTLTRSSTASMYVCMYAVLRRSLPQ